MKYAIVFLIIGIYFIRLGFILGATGLLISWSGISFVAVAAAYAGLGARVVDNALDAEVMIKKVRPSVEFSNVQRRLLERFVRLRHLNRN